MYGPFAVCISMPTGKFTISTMSKRKFEDVAGGEPEAMPQRQRRRTRSSSVPLMSETVEPEKREALRRLFGRFCTVNNNQDNHRNHPRSPPEDNEDHYYEYILDENEDPLLDDIPVNMDAEQLGFLVCAQETLRFLHLRGFTSQNPMFVRLRSRLIQGIEDIAAA